MGHRDFYCDEVLSGRLAAVSVFEDELVLAFHHTKPSYRTHIVVIPKKHVSSFIAADDGDDAHVLATLRAAREIARGVVAHTGACRVITNCGEYRDSQHLHWHIVSDAG